MREQTIGEHLDRLASPDIRVRGSAAALQAAQAAALIERSAALALHTTDAEETMRAARAEAGRMRERAMRVGHAEAFANGHPPAEHDVEVPLRIAALAADLIRLAGTVRDGADDDVLPYLAAAAASARGALEASAAWVGLLSAGDGSDKEVRARLNRHLGAVPYAEDMVDRARQAVG